MNEQPNAAPAAPTATPEQTAFTRTELSPRDQQTALADLKEFVAKGKLSTEEAAKYFDELQTPMENRTDTRTEAAKELDAAGFVPAKGNAFVLSFSDEVLPPEGKQSIRTWLEHLESDLTSGNTFIKTFDEVGRHYVAIPEAQRPAWAAQEMGKLQRLYGDRLPEKFQQARTTIDLLEAQRPGLKALLNSGVGDSARVVAQIFALSERYHARRG